MKKYFLVLVLLWIGCKEDPKTKQFQADMVEMANEHKNERHYRRFTYFVEGEDPKISELFKSVDWKALAQSYKGVRSVQAYKKDNGFFFIYDTDSSLDEKQLMDIITSNEGYADFDSQLIALGVELKEYQRPLERIFKLNQKKVHTSMEGQLNKDVGPHKRFVWTLLLQEDPEMITEYKKIHSMDQFWPQIRKNMEVMGIKDMEIYLYGTRAILIMDAKPDFDMAIEGPKWQKLPRETEWQEYVAKFQRTEAGTDIQEKWQDMHKL
ncbi:MAG: L-rhamnose mutarotase [Allomuricauda sp.]